VDPGPSSTIPILLKALYELGVEKLDYILLTHIHLDHGGGAGDLLTHFPQAHINCHPRGIPHLIDPTDLWKGSLNVLGEVAEAYGPVKPVAESSISYQKKINLNGEQIRIIEIPGHASHQIGYQMDDLLFAAEVAGVSIVVEDGYYQRIATPPRFVFDVYQKSLRKVAALPAKHLCLGHHGMRSEAQIFFATAQAQLDFWMNMIKKHVHLGEAYDGQTLFEELLDADPALSLFSKLDADIQKREKYFCLNSIRGMAGYFNHLINEIK